MSMGPGQQGAWGGGGGAGGYADSAPLMSNSQQGQRDQYPPQGGGGFPPAVGPHGDPYGLYGGGGGAKAISAGNHINEVFFAAACCIIFGSLFGGIGLITYYDFVDWLEMTYLMFFGIILAVLDTPLMKSIKLVMDSKLYIGKYVQFVTRVTGKGLTLLFLGSSLFLTIWDNFDNFYMRSMAVLFSIVPAFVGLGAIVIGVMKSLKLDRVRKQLTEVIDQRYDAVAQTYTGPHGGLTMTEFNKLVYENGGGVRFEPQDLKLIFNALVSNPTWRQQVGAPVPQNHQGYQMPGAHGHGLENDLKIPKQDLLDWCRDGMVLL